MVIFDQDGLVKYTDHGEEYVLVVFYLSVLSTSGHFDKSYNIRFLSCLSAGRKKLIEIDLFQMSNFSCAASNATKLRQRL